MDHARKEVEIIQFNDLRNLFGELRLMAKRMLAAEVRSHSFTPTALAITALRRAKLKDQDWEDVRWENRAHFFAALALAMRHALTDHARRKNAKGRDNLLYFSPDENFFLDLPASAQDRPFHFLLLEEAVVRLEELDKRLADVVQQYYYAGYSIGEMAQFTGVSEKTVDRDLKKARTLLRKLMEDISQVT